MLLRTLWVRMLERLLLLGWTFLICTPQSAAAQLPAETCSPTIALQSGHSGVSCALVEKQTDTLNTAFLVSVGLRRDDFDWSIAGYNDAGSKINVRSELEWSNVQSYQLRLDNRTLLADFFYFRGYFSYAAIKDGTVRDSDYNGNNRSDEYSRSISTSSGDQFWDLSCGFGYPFNFKLPSASLLLVPMLGGSLHKQNFRITEGYQVINAPGGELGPIPGLDSTFEARWIGPWLGCDLRFLTGSASAQGVAMEFGLALEYHFLARYEAKANWNLRSDFEHPKSFEQEADGQGLCLQAEWVVRPWSRWDLQFMTTYQRWETTQGTNRFFISGAGSRSTRLNTVHWTTYSFMAGLTYHFF